MALVEEISKLGQPAAQLPDVESSEFDNAIEGTPSNGKVNRSSTFFTEGPYEGKKAIRADYFSHGNADDDARSEDSNVSHSLEKDSDDDDVDEEESGSDEEGDAEEDTGFTSATQPANGVFLDLVEKTKDDSASKKVAAIEEQQRIWEKLMFANIRIHSLLKACNVLPRGDLHNEILKKSDKETRKNLKKTMENNDKLSFLMSQAVELFSKDSSKEESDEEITSEEEAGDEDSDAADGGGHTDEEMSDGESDANIEEAKSTKACKSISARKLAETFEQSDNKFEKFRTQTLKKWQNRTNFMAKTSKNNRDFSAFDSEGICTQINKVMKDEPRLLRRVHTKRSDYNRIGSDPSGGVDDEVFDDGDFYQSLLKQMIETKSLNTSDTADMTRNYIELQKMCSSQKRRNTAGLSSKERRLKFEPITKLINFHPARPELVTWSHESRNELFKSLFT